MPDFLCLPIMVTAREKAFFDKSQALGHAGLPSFGAPFTKTPFNWQVFDFEGGPYLGFARDPPRCEVRNQGERSGRR